MTDKRCVREVNLSVGREVRKRGGALRPLFLSSCRSFFKSSEYKLAGDISKIRALLTFGPLHYLHLCPLEELKQRATGCMPSEPLLAHWRGRTKRKRTLSSIVEAILQQCSMLLAKIKYDRETFVMKVYHSNDVRT